MNDFDWDEGNSWKVESHGLDPEEVEEAFYDPHRIPAPAYRGPGGERRHALIGATETDRVLFVVYTYRGDAIRVITAYSAEPREQRKYWDRRARRE